MTEAQLCLPSSGKSKTIQIILPLKYPRGKKCRVSKPYRPPLIRANLAKNQGVLGKTYMDRAFRMYPMHNNMAQIKPH